MVVASHVDTLHLILAKEELRTKSGPVQQEQRRPQQEVIRLGDSPAAAAKSSLELRKNNRRRAHIL